MESKITPRQSIAVAIEEAERAILFLKDREPTGERECVLGRIRSSLEHMRRANEGLAETKHPGRDVFAHEPDGPRILGIDATDDIGPGGAYHEYQVRFLHPCEPHGAFLHIKFQKGPARGRDANGVTNEALLAIVQHRLECFQAGPFPCDENAQSLNRVREALHWLHQRTADRKRRRVEGINAA